MPTDERQCGPSPDERLDHPAEPQVLWNALCAQEDANAHMIQSMFLHERAHHDIFHQTHYLDRFLHAPDNARHRRIIFDWVMEVGHAFQLSRDVVGTALELIDRFWAIRTFQSCGVLMTLIRRAMYGVNAVTGNHPQPSTCPTHVLVDIPQLIWSYCDNPRERYTLGAIGPSTYQLTALCCLRMAANSPTGQYHHHHQLRRQEEPIVRTGNVVLNGSLVTDDEITDTRSSNLHTAEPTGRTDSSETLALEDCIWVSDGQLWPQHIVQTEKIIRATLGGRTTVVSAFRWLHLFMSRARLLDDKECLQHRQRDGRCDTLLPVRTLEGCLDQPWVAVTGGRLTPDVYRFQYMSSLIDLIILHHPGYFRMYHSALAASILYVTCKDYFLTRPDPRLEGGMQDHLPPSELLPQNTWFETVCGYRLPQLTPIIHYLERQVMSCCPPTLIVPSRVDDTIVNLVRPRNDQQSLAPLPLPLLRKTLDVDSAPFQLQIHQPALLSLVSRLAVTTPVV